jgi:subtilisin family serine protease
MRLPDVHVRCLPPALEFGHAVRNEVIGTSVRRRSRAWSSRGGATVRALGVVTAVLAALLVLSVGSDARADDRPAERRPVQADLNDLLGRRALPATSETSGTELPTPARARAPRYILELDGASRWEHALAFLRTGRTIDVVGESRAEVESLGARVEGSIDGHERYLQIDPVTVDIADLASIERVRAVHPDEFIPLGTVDVRDPAPWHLDRIDQRDRPLDGRYHASTTGAGVLVYVVDSGLYPFGANAEFALERTELWYASGSEAEETLQGLDCNGHGTHVAGTVAGQRAGVAPGVRLISIKANDRCEDGFSSFNLLAWFDFIMSNRVDTRYPGRGSGIPTVVNLSLGARTTSDLLDRGVAAMIDQGITVVVAAGNENEDACAFSPARVASAITVGSTGTTDRRSSFSNRGGCVDVLAPGEGVLGPYVDSRTCEPEFYLQPDEWDQGRCMAVGTAALNGTSMATPIVAGVAARLLQASPGASPSDVKRGIEGGAVPVLSNLGSGTPNRLVNTLFMEGAALSLLEAPDLRALRIGSTVLRQFSVQGGRAPIRYEVSAGTLPPGLSLTLNGMVEGQVSGPGSGSSAVRVSDAVGQHLTIVIPWSSRGVPNTAAVEITVVPTNRALVASWPSGSFDVVDVARGSEVARVEVRATPEVGGRSRGCAVSRRVGRGAPLANGCTISRLANDVPYRVEVRARNGDGWTAWTPIDGADLDARTPVPVAPSVARNLRVQAISGALRVTWAAPSSDGGAPPSYDVQVRPTNATWPPDSGDAADLVCSGLPARQRSCVVTSAAGLEWGLAHEVRVRATNSRGVSSWTTSTHVVPFTTPELEGIALDVSTASQTFRLAWNRTEIDGRGVARGGPISRLELRAVPEAGRRTRGCVVTRSRTGVLPTGCTIGGLEDGRPHRIEVRARNRAGWTAWLPLSPDSTVRTGISLSTAGRWTPDLTPMATAIRADIGDDGTILVELTVRSTTELVAADVRLWDVSGEHPELAPADCDQPVGPSVGDRRVGTWMFTCVPTDAPGSFAVYRVTAGPLRAESGAIGHLDENFAALTVRSSALAILGSVPADEPESSGELTISSVNGLLVPGETFEVAGAGFLPASEVRLVVYPEGMSVGSFVAGSDGAFEGAVEFDDPGDVAPRTLAAVGIDAAGHQLRSLTAQVSFDRAGPEVVEVLPSGGEFSPGDAFTVSVTVRDPSGVDGVMFSLVEGGSFDEDGRLVGGVQRDFCGQQLAFASADVVAGTETWSLECVVPSMVVGGEYRVLPSAVDGVGNWTNTNGGRDQFVSGTFSIR